MQKRDCGVSIVLVHQYNSSSRSSSSSHAFPRLRPARANPLRRQHRLRATIALLHRGRHHIPGHAPRLPRDAALRLPRRLHVASVPGRAEELVAVLHQRGVVLGILLPFSLSAAATTTLATATTTRDSATSIAASIAAASYLPFQGVQACHFDWHDHTALLTMGAGLMRERRLRLAGRLPAMWRLLHLAVTVSPALATLTAVPATTAATATTAAALAHRDIHRISAAVSPALVTCSRSRQRRPRRRARALAVPRPPRGPAVRVAARVLSRRP
mmetsp:Transcript_8750/g.26031  ORF Transcript_8750/g.26031 Transcript_8750/m.26031 type:complete len:272 (-) Transcript_8750:400-1215(-)